METSDKPHNEYPNSVASQVLPSGYQLEDYVIEKEIGAGGFGVTYKAYDTQLKRHVAIKEYFPFNLAMRDDSMHVSPKTRVAEDVDEYSWGLSRFIQEARTLALFEHESIIRVIRFIEKNSTAYIIMDFADGRDVSDVIKNDGLLTVSEIKKIILPIATGLKSVHDADMLHRDIKPGNIRIKSNGLAVLIDFGAARQAIGVRSQSISTILTPGYAPIEQYSSRGNQGPWTDIYSLAAVAYVCLTGENLSHFEATDRIRRDTLPKLVDRVKDDDISFLSALDWAMSPEEEDRPQTVNEWLEVISKDSELNKRSQDAYSTPTVKVPKLDGFSEPDDSNKLSVPNNTEKKTLLVKGGVAFVGVIVGGVMLYMAGNIGEKDTSGEKIIGSKPSNTNILPNKIENVPVFPKPVQVETSREIPKQSSMKQDYLDFSIASKINTVEAYELYLRLHPNGRHRQTAISRRR